MPIYNLFTSREPLTTDVVYLADENGEQILDENSEAIIATGARSPLAIPRQPLSTPGRTLPGP